MRKAAILVSAFIIIMLIGGLGFPQTDPPYFDHDAVDQSMPTLPPPPLHNTGGLCDLGPNRAATLLIPYFEVEPIEEGEQGLDTLVAVTNVSSDPVVAHVTLYNVDGVPFFNFNIFLTGYDVTTFSMRDIINGYLPNNGCDVIMHEWDVDGVHTEELLDPDDDDRFAVGWIDCNGDGKYFGQDANHSYYPEQFENLFNTDCEWAGGTCDVACYPHPLSQETIDYLQYMTTDCSLWSSSNKYLGYLTIDANYTCNGGYPVPQIDESLKNDLSYWYSVLDVDHLFDNSNDGDPLTDPDLPVVSNSNTLIGDWFLVDFRRGYARGFSAVHIEALGFNRCHNESGNLADQYYGLSCTDFASNISGTGLNTFYGSSFPHFAPQLTGKSVREPLPTSWALRFLGNEDYSISSSAIIWRQHNWQNGPYPTGGATYPQCYSYLYDFFGSNVTKYPDVFALVFDEEENEVNVNPDPDLPCPIWGCPPPEPDYFYYLYNATMHYYISDNFRSPFPSGWINIDFASDSRTNGLPYNPADMNSAYDQSWVEVLHTGWDTYFLDHTGQIIQNHCSHTYSTNDPNNTGNGLEPAITITIHDDMNEEP